MEEGEKFERKKVRIAENVELIPSQTFFLQFLSSANEVSSGPTCQFLCVSCVLCGFPVFFRSFWLVELLASDSGSGTPLIHLGVVRLSYPIQDVIRLT